MNTSAVVGAVGQHALGVAGQQDALDAGAEPHAGRARRTTELLDEAVVAPAAADGVLGRVERVRRELEQGAGVVVEAAHQAGVEHVRDAEGVEPGAHPVEVGAALAGDR